MLKSARVQSLKSVLQTLKANPYLKKEEAEKIRQIGSGDRHEAPAASEPAPEQANAPSRPAPQSAEAPVPVAEAAAPSEDSSTEPDEQVSTYIKEHEEEIAKEGSKPFQAVGGIVELLGPDYFPVTQEADVPSPTPVASGPPGAAAKPAPGQREKPLPGGEPKRENTMQKINRLDVKGRIQLALKGNKEERSILIRDGTKVVALAVLEAPKLSDGEVEKFAGQKNVLEAVLRQIPLKRRFVKNYIVVRNLVANPRTPIDIGLALMKNLLVADLKNLSANKEVSETVRKLALKMFKQKLESANKK